MVELVEVIAKALVDDKDAVEVSSHKVIGKQGRIAKALRTVVKAAATKQNAKVVVEIVQ